MERCAQCEKISLLDSLPNPASYLMALDSMNSMIEAKELVMTYQTCPIPDVLKGGKFFTQKMFHQVQCTKCGTVYGLLCDTGMGDGQLKINPKVFNPDDYDFSKER
ncbi:MAG: hypothetical protein GX896_02685 [Clostridiales bacterium]|nr:hypothetical protein [Clostridiales bacterium]